MREWITHEVAYLDRASMYAEVRRRWAPDLAMPKALVTR